MASSDRERYLPLGQDQVGRRGAQKVGLAQGEAEGQAREHVGLPVSQSLSGPQCFFCPSFSALKPSGAQWCPFRLLSLVLQAHMLLSKEHSTSFLSQNKA